MLSMIYTVTTTLPPIHGGRTKSLLSRVKFLDTELNAPTKILTTNYNVNYNDVYKLFSEEDKVTANITYENLYDWLSDFKLLTFPQTKLFKKVKYNEQPLEIEGLKHEIAKNKRIVRYYDQDNTYVLYRKYYDDQSVIEFEDFMSPISKKRVQRWQYNKYGVLHRKIYYAPNTLRKVLEEFFDIDGNIYYKKSYNDSELNTLIYIQTYKNNRPYKTFKSEKQLFQYYFESKFKDEDVVFCDARLLDKPLLKQKRNTKNILVFHSSHLNNGNIQDSYKYALNTPDKISKYILLTNKQKQDIQNVTSIDSNKFAVIPHFIKSTQPLDNIKKENRFVFVGRIAPEKQIDHILTAYKAFLKTGYDTTLSIYGKSELGQLEIIKQMIHEYKIQDKVHINDYTTNPSLEFQKSKASLLTSSFEGFGLTTMESINIGCPVISYDMRYGASEIINHGENGYLVEANNIAELTKYMVKVIETPLSNVKTKPELTFDSAKNNYKQLFNSINYNI